MGLIKAAMAAAGSTLADQWKEFFYCDALSSDVMVVKVRNASAENQATQKEATTSSHRGPESR